MNYKRALIMQNPHLTLWLKIMCFLIITMIFIGGYTRLTDSGLSITEWKPVSGVLPPISLEAWNEEFEKYKQSPEYIKVNNGINLQEFKSIFWIEFIHRIAGRITGLVYLLPFMYFLVQGSIRGKDILIYSAGLILLTGQGFAGWYMVKSGLVNAPNVSHFRLALHLFLAVSLYGLLFWRLLNITGSHIVIARSKTTKQSQEAEVMHVKTPEIATSAPPRNDVIDHMRAPLKVARYRISKLLNLSLILLFTQIVFGAFVAGLDAGLVYNQFPLMGDSFIPHEVTSNPLSSLSFSDPVFIQFIHRILAYIVTITILVTCLVGFKIHDRLLSKVLFYLILALIFQVTAGILTLIYLVPIIIALLHQLGAVIMLSLLLWAKFLVTR